MKFAAPFALLLTLTSSVIAFPAIRPDQLNIRDPVAFQKLVREAVSLASVARKDSEEPTEPALTPDPNDKEHEFQPPGKGDQRGPCP